ncbi:hypothetical protein VPH35_068437 [Triticum aestivum]
MDTSQPHTLSPAKARCTATPRRHRARGQPPPGQEELLECIVLDRSAREHEEMEECIRRELEYERLFLQTGVAASQAHASKEVDLRLMKAEQAKFCIDLDSSDSD